MRSIFSIKDLCFVVFYGKSGREIGEGIITLKNLNGRDVLTAGRFARNWRVKSVRIALLAKEETRRISTDKLAVK
ncbi:MAG: hypothetical protein Q7T51_01320 [Candidatus Moranbacteria bacterium]|nr:hypothetical protein [Candidatus Moranbacteria bacterium]